MKPRLLLTTALLAALCPNLFAGDFVILQMEKKGSLLPPIVIEMFEGDAPKHSANFKKLVSSGFYTNTSIHRVLPNALIQMGDPISRQKNPVDLGTGGPGYTVPPEIKLKHAEAAVGMGRLPDKINPGRLSNGSQFYMTLRPLPELDGTQTVFGKVTQGLEVLKELGTCPTDTNDAPVERVICRRSKVVPKEKLDRSLRGFHAGPPSFWSRMSAYLPKFF